MLSSLGGQYIFCRKLKSPQQLTSSKACVKSTNAVHKGYRSFLHFLKVASQRWSCQFGIFCVWNHTETLGVRDRLTTVVWRGQYGATSYRQCSGWLFRDSCCSRFYHFVQCDDNGISRIPHHPYTPSSSDGQCHENATECWHPLLDHLGCNSIVPWRRFLHEKALLAFTSSAVVGPMSVRTGRIVLLLGASPVFWPEYNSR